MKHAPRFVQFSALALALAAGLSGCLVSGSARLSTSGSIAYSEPPPPQEEVVSHRRGYVWIKGRWDWRGGQWVWVAGRWEAERGGYAWEAGRWERRGRNWHWVEGRWVVGAASHGGGHSGGGTVIVSDRPGVSSTTTSPTVRCPDGSITTARCAPVAAPPTYVPPPAPATVVVSDRPGRPSTVVVPPGNWPTQPPPAPQAERVGTARRGYFWQPGRWVWQDGKYSWRAGSWQKAQASKTWSPGRWELRGSVYIWIDGSWN
ncbi:MAG: YXWGXW repeat-containing protein [Myxococcales bacterium]|nr:YXWGXW repeat-containing protein [Myxococcales bacterium]